MSAETSPTRDIETRLRQLEDEKAVMSTLYAYGIHSDHGPPQEWLALFLPDAVLESRGPSSVVGQLLGRGGEATDEGVRFEGHQKLAGFLQGGVRDERSEVKHYTIQPQVTVTGDTASAVSYFLAVAYANDVNTTYGIGRFVDRLARSADGRWRFSERIIWVAGKAERPSWNP